MIRMRTSMFDDNESPSIQATDTGHADPEVGSTRLFELKLIYPVQLRRAAPSDAHKGRSLGDGAGGEQESALHVTQHPRSVMRSLPRRKGAATQATHGST